MSIATGCSCVCKTTALLSRIVLTQFKDSTLGRSRSSSSLAIPRFARVVSNTRSDHGPPGAIPPQLNIATPLLTSVHPLRAHTTAWVAVQHVLLHMRSSAHALPRAGATSVSPAAVNDRVARRNGCRKSSHSRVVASQRLPVHTKATTGPVHASAAPRAVSPAELNEVGASF